MKTQKRPVQAFAAPCIAADDWRVIEKAYGRQIPDEARQVITDGVREYAALGRADSNVRVEDVRAHFGKIRKQAAKLRDLVTNPASEAEREACDLIDRKNATRTIGRLIVLANDAERRWSKLAPHFESDAWDRWVFGLTAICNKYGLPRLADKRVEDAPFVTLVRKLQDYLPEGCRRHLKNDVALTQAIYRARDKKS